MSAKNSVHIMGRLTADPELRIASSGVKMCRFTVAAERDLKDASGERQSDFISVTAWRNTAEFICKYFTKGKMIAVEGELRTGSYSDRKHPDVTHYTTDVNASAVAFCGDKSPKSSESPRQSDKTEPSDDLSGYDEIISDGDLPF